MEWLSWNWRAWYNSSRFHTPTSMVFNYLNEEVPLFPSPEDILYGIILG